MLIGICNKKEEIPYEKITGYQGLPVFLIYVGMPGAKEDTFDMITPHWHRNLEIIYTRDSKSVMMINGEKTEILPDQIQIINSRDIHSVVSAECTHPYHGVTFQLSFDFLKTRIPDIDMIRFTINSELTQVIKPILSEIISLYQEDKIKNTPIISALCYALV